MFSSHLRSWERIVPRKRKDFTNFIETVGEGGDCSRGDGGSGNVKLDVIGVAVKAESMTTYDVAEGKQVKDE